MYPLTSAYWPRSTGTLTSSSASWPRTQSVLIGHGLGPSAFGLVSLYISLLVIWNCSLGETMLVISNILDESRRSRDESNMVPDMTEDCSPRSGTHGVPSPGTPHATVQSVACTPAVRCRHAKEALPPWEGLH